MDTPPRIHVLVVDDDPLSLMVLERMLRRCQYQVTTCTRVAAALQLLREHTETFDLVMSDVYMPDADGFNLLETVGLEMDLPVIMMSANGETSVVMKGITHGACDYLIKPIRMEELKTIWQHVIRRKGTKDIGMRSGAQLEEVSPDDSMDIDFEPDQYPAGNKTQSSTEKQFECIVDDMNDVNNMKKARVKWSAPLHEKFVMAVNELGVDKAAPKKILELMGVPSLTREHVASHLQKYRLTLKRLSTIPSPYASLRTTMSDQPEGSMRAQPFQRSANMPYAIPARGPHPNVVSGLARTSSMDVGWMDAMENNSRLSEMQQRMAANRAQVLGELGLKTSGSSPFFISTKGNAATRSLAGGGTLHRATASGSFVPSGNRLMGGGGGGGDGGGGGGLFRMGSLDIGLLLKMQQEEEEMEQSQKGGCKDEMDGFATALSHSSRNVFPMTPAGGQQQSRRLSRPPAGGGTRPMIPMPVPPSGSTTQQVSTSSIQARKRMGPIASTPFLPSSDTNANINSYIHQSMNKNNPGMGGFGRRVSGDFTMDQTSYTAKYNNDMQASPSSSQSTSLSNPNSSPSAFSTSSPSSTMSFDSFEGSAACSDASSFLHNKAPTH